MKVWYWLGSIFVIAYIAFQYYLLAYSPLPWFDETLFADISLTFSQTRELKPNIAIFREVKTYGPVYFSIVSVFYKFFGFDLLTFRTVNFLFGILSILMLFLWLWQITKKWSFERYLLLSILILSDPFFNLCWHEGRMDLTALFFTLSSFWAWEKSKEQQKYAWLLLGSLLGVMTFLTTPRVGFIFLAWGLTQLIFLRQSFPKSLFHLSLFTGLIIGLYHIWIFGAFGSYQIFIDYFTKPAQDIQQASSISLFLGGDGYIPRQEYPLIFCSMILLVLSIFQVKSNYNPSLVIASILSILFFYLMVDDFGQYSILILLFYYLLIGISILNQKKWLHFPSLLIIGLLFYNLSYQSLKTAQILTSLPQRNAKKVEQWIGQYIPPNSKVIGDEMYYYIVKKNGADFQYFNDWYEDRTLREKRQRKDWNYDYIIVTKHFLWRKPDLVEFYLSQAEFEKIATYQVSQSEWNEKIDALGLISNVERTGYNAVIYRRIK